MTNTRDREITPMGEDLVERLTRKRDRVHPTNRRANLSMLVRLSFADLEALIANSTTLQQQRREIEAYREALKHVADGGAFRMQRFAEDDDAEYFLRCQREVQKLARKALLSTPDNPKGEG